MNFLVRTLAVLSHTLLQLLCVSVVRDVSRAVFAVLLVVEVVLDRLILALVQREELAAPNPVQGSLAVVVRLVERTACTDLLRNDSRGLQTISQDDVGVHSANINVVDQRLCHYDWATVSQLCKLGLNLVANLVVVSDLRLILVPGFHKQSEVKDLLRLVNQHLISLFLETELNWEVTPVNTLFQTLYVATDVSL